MPVLISILSAAMLMAPVQTSTTQPKTQPVAAKSSTTASMKKPAASMDVAVTIHGLCPDQPAAKAKVAADCNTVITKEQFDVVLNALNAIGPQLLPAQKRGVAQGYVATLLSYNAAKKAGVEKDPRFAEVMRLARMRAMGDMYNARMLEKAKKVSPEAIQAYYTANIDKFEELTMRRITLPRFNSANLKDEEFAAKASKVANDIHDRAAKGEDLETLQKEAFETLGLKNPPTTRMAIVRRGIYSGDQEKQLFALKPGEVTPIIEQPSALIIFKLESRETPSLETSKDEIMRILTKQNLEKQEQAKTDAVKVDYNEQIVGPEPNSGWMPAAKLNEQATPPAAQSKAESPK